MSFVRLSLLALVLGVPCAAHAVDLAELSAGCDSCHGPKGISSDSDVPTIAGQTVKYLSETLESFQVWGRPCIKSKYRHGDTSRPKTDMCKISSGLADEDIAALSAHYSALPFVPAKQDFDASLVATGAQLHEESCEKCHHDGGSTAGTGPRLAGQWTPYMKMALKYVPTGEHQVPRMMENSVAKFGPDDINALMSFYASQQN